ncbi:MAG: HAD-IC family P-type ATPase, partial [Oscillospiraceae bacterium]
MPKAVNLNGLSEEQARKNIVKYGRNELVSQKPKSPMYLFLSQFKDVLILILAAATIFSVIVGQMTEAVTIISIMLLNAVMGFVQEYRTEKTIQSLKQMTAPVARVRRDGKKFNIDAALVAVGDVIELRAGDRIPADALLHMGVGFKTDESILSGESKAIDKKPGAVGHNQLFMGTSVMSGHGIAVVEKTGMSTEMGKIANLLGEVKEEPTPLQRRLASLGKFIAISCLACGASVAALGLARGENAMDMVLTGISLAVAAIPEGLPAIVTIVLALSVNRILSRGAVIRRLHAVETLGSATIICTDKTGTITENKMTVTELYSDFTRFSLSGGGNMQLGKLSSNGKVFDINASESLKAALVCCAMCSNSSVEPNGAKALTVRGNPTETALLCAAFKCGIKKDELIKKFHLLDEIPFDSTRKMMSVYVKHGDRLSVMTKGAPDRILEKCSYIGTDTGVRPITASDRRRLGAELERMANDAQRVLAIAIKQGDFNENALTFLAFAGMKDPPRREVKGAVELCRRAGIKPMMITGDHALTARAIAREVGIMTDAQRVVEGAEIESSDDARLRALVERTSVFARVSPTHKLRIVNACKQNGHIIAMAGDGVNDAPAIKSADIGVAMGISGSDVTKEASSVVILDDNFATIVAAVEEGRIIYQNIKRFI